MPLPTSCRAAGRQYEKSSPTSTLLADIEPVDNVEVTLRINLLQIIEQSPPSTDQHQKTTSTGKILLMASQVVGQPVDPAGENRDLNLG